MSGFYAILEVAQDATDSEITKAYRALALRYHPDKNKSPEAEEKFKMITEAYATLGDVDKRHVYDQSRSVRFHSNEPAHFVFKSASFNHPSNVPPKWQYFQRMPPSSKSFSNRTVNSDEINPQSQQQHNDISDKASDLPNFAGLNSTTTTSQPFSTNRKAQFNTLPLRPKPTNPSTSTRHHSVFQKLTAIRCVETDNAKNQSIKSPQNNSPPVPKQPPAGPSKTIAPKVQDLLVTLEDIYHGCTKTVNIIWKIDPRSSNMKKHPKTIEKTLKVKIRPGTKSNSALVFPKKGSMCSEVIIVIRDKPHPVFFRVGEDVRHLAIVDLSTALCGGSLAIPTLKGYPVPYSIIKIISPGTTIRLPGLGLPFYKQSKHFGDIIVDFEVKFPEIIPDDCKFFIRKFWETSGIQDDNKLTWKSSETMRKKCPIVVIPPVTKLCWDLTLQKLAFGPMDISFANPDHPEAIFDRNGADLRHTKIINLKTALCGGTINFPTLEGSDVPFTIGKILKPGSYRRIPGLGLPLPHRGGLRGDLIVHFDIAFPEECPVHCRQYLRNILKMSDVKPRYISNDKIPYDFGTL